ncbi:MAG TPA: glycosyltransferase [Patescibacteria group bacterium]|nr:glycosyltransferase [Patescibacteria group bacterium]
MRIALVHDYLAQDGGAERVLKAFHEIWPEAPIFVLFHDEKKINYFNRENIRESFLKNMPFVSSRFQWYLPLMPIATEKHDLRGYDVVLSSTSTFAKGVLTHPGTLHISYCHTPTRFLWSDTDQYLTDLNYNAVVRAVLMPLLYRLRLWDKMSADRADHFIANSQTVHHRIYKYYRRESDVITPPIDTTQFTPSETVDTYFVAGGRLVPYKRLDIAVQAFNRLRLPLKIFGTGPELNRLQRMAKPNIEFLGRISESEKANLLKRAQAFIHPQIEDFGITPLESMASGRPVIAFASGGATETVVPKQTGVFFHEQNWEALVDTLLHFDKNDWNSTLIQEHAQQFDILHFKNKIQDYVHHRFEEFKNGLRQPSLIA